VNTFAGPAGPSAGANTVSPWLVLLLATACGFIAANMYYAQPLAGPISAALGFSQGTTGLIVTMTQVGCGMGMLLVVPLGDLFENRRLALILLGIIAIASLGAALAFNPLSFLIAAWFIGLGTVAVHVLVPYAAHMAPEAVRGRVVGNVMSGLLLGIMLARPVASAITAFSSWHAVFFFSAAAATLIAFVLARSMRPRQPQSRPRYADLLRSMWRLVRTTPILRRRSLYHAALSGAFSLFWTTVPLLLAGPAFRLSQGGIALFGLAGVAGAIAAPVTGRIADRGWSRPASVFAIAAAAGAFLLTHIAQQGSPLSLGLLVAAAIVLDFGVSANMTLGQRAIFSLGAEFRSRLNGIYMTMFFSGGAIGSALGGWSYAHGGWNMASWFGFALPVAALLYLLTEL
jgi:predicted MFS family arabinose efflux permease